MVSATKGGADLKVSAQQAAEATAGLVQLMPEEWRGDPGVPALANLPNRPDCEPVLKELTRGVPLHMLLDRGEDSLHPKNDRSKLAAPDFFSSTPNDDILAFTSHRWAADPSMTVQGLHMAVILRFGRIFVSPARGPVPRPRCSSPPAPFSQAPALHHAHGCAWACLLYLPLALCPTFGLSFAVALLPVGRLLPVYFPPIPRFQEQDGWAVAGQHVPICASTLVRQGLRAPD